MTTEPLVIEIDRVIMEGDWAKDVIYDLNTDDLEFVEVRNLFEELFEILPGRHMGDLAESFYQDVLFMRVIRRKSDGRLFGYPYWEPVAKYVDWIYEIDPDDAEPNGDENGLPIVYVDDGTYANIERGPFWVWKPVKVGSRPVYYIDE